METKEQTYEVVLSTTDEEIDGENLIESAIGKYLKELNSKHISNISVSMMRNEWAD